MEIRQNKIVIKLDYEFLVMQASVDTNNQDTGELKKTLNKHDS